MQHKSINILSRSRHKIILPEDEKFTSMKHDGM